MIICCTSHDFHSLAFFTAAPLEKMTLDQIRSSDFTLTAKSLNIAPRVAPGDTAPEGGATRIRRLPLNKRGCRSPDVDWSNSDVDQLDHVEARGGNRHAHAGDAVGGGVHGAEHLAARINYNERIRHVDNGFGRDREA